MTINTIPIPCFNGPATQIRVDDGHVRLDVGANFQWALLNVSGQIVSGPGRSDLTSGQYASWTGDDAFVVECIAENIGVTISP